MKAEFRQTKHTLYEQFTQQGADDVTAIIAACALTRQQVYGVVPNETQQKAIDECHARSFQPIKQRFSLNPFTLFVWFRQRQIARYLDAQILE